MQENLLDGVKLDENLENTIRYSEVSYHNKNPFEVVE